MYVDVRKTFHEFLELLNHSIFAFFFSSLYNRKGKRSLEIVRYYRLSHVLLH